ncbi:hypothetical protein AWE51_25685 [Aquimarina aggregata]|uniref:Uncharacterized protein n=1 Tax=Aquimarina aggregata TaxID=1642818 RepID=A0A162Z2E3_9FLAO|nr:hypothetical protein [Aquimarina aggregata]KZS39512.1 hypothetical protein AWE51_25685 [Aquimarina aggregata]
MKYSKEDILEIIISSYQFQAEFDPMVGKEMEPNFKTTIFEWRDICDLIEPNKLAQVYYKNFNLKTPISELEQLFTDEDKNTLSDFCEYISKHSEKQNIEPIKLLGQNCQTASIFRTLKQNLKEKGADISELKPSSEINPFFLKYGGLLVDEVNRIAPGTMSEFEFKANKLSRIGRNIMFVGFFTGIGIWWIWSFNWFLLLPIAFGIVMFQIGDKKQPEKINISGFENFRELIYGMDKKMKTAST